MVSPSGLATVGTSWSNLPSPTAPRVQQSSTRGASITIVDKTFAEDHPDLFEPDGESDGTDADGNTFSTPLVKIAPLTMLGSHFTATLGAVVDLSAANQTAERPMQMIVGWPLLRHGRFAIDHAAARASHEQSPPPVR